MKESVLRLAENIYELKNKMFVDILDTITMEIDIKHNFGKLFYDMMVEHTIDNKVHDFLIENFKGDITLYLDTVGEKYNNENWLDIFLDKCYDYLM